MKKFLLICTLFYSALFAYAGPDDELCDMLDAWTMIDCGYDPDPNQHGGF